MPVVAQQLVADTTLIEQFGEVVECRTSYLVRVGSSPNILKTALDDADVPQPGVPVLANHPNLRVEEREARIVGVEGSDYKVHVAVLMRLQRAESLYSLRGGTSLRQITTQVDRDGNQITVKYNDREQGGEVEVLQPQSNFVVELVEATDDPDSISTSWAGHVNSDSFRGFEKETWLCTRVDYELINEAVTPRRYRFVFEFENDPNGWNPTAVYRDPETREIPHDLKEGVGIKDIPWYPSRPFSDKFGQQQN